MTLQKEFVQVLQKGFHAVQVFCRRACLLIIFDHVLWLCFPRCGSKCPGKGRVRRQLTSQSARSRSPRHGLVSLHGQQEPQHLQGAVALALGADPAPSSLDRPSSSSAQPPLRNLLADYFLTNTLSAQRLQMLASSSAVSGAQGLEDLMAAGAHGSAPHKSG